MQTKPAIGVVTVYAGRHYFGAMLSGIREVACAAGFQVIVIQSSLHQLRLPLFSADHVAGWIVLHPTDQDVESLRAIMASGTPVITAATATEPSICSAVLFDNRSASRDLVNHLIEHGHRRIAFVDHGREDWSRERYQGYLDAIGSHGIEPDAHLVIDVSGLMRDTAGVGPVFLQRRGRAAAHELLRRGMPCTALVAGTDLSAIGAIAVLRDYQIRVPADVAVVGFDDLPEARSEQPPLTTMCTRFDHLGRVAAERLLSSMASPHNAQPQRVYVQSKLVLRASCGCAEPTLALAKLAEAIVAMPDWSAGLAEALESLVQMPSTDGGSHVWHGLPTILAALQTTLRGERTAHLRADLVVACEQAVMISDDAEALDSVATLIEAVVERCLSTAATAEHLECSKLCRLIRNTIMRAQLVREMSRKQALLELASLNYEISLALLAPAESKRHILEWLSLTPATWGCLAVWDHPDSAGEAWLTIADNYLLPPAQSMARTLRCRAAAFPSLNQLPAAALADDELTILTPVRAEGTDLGVLALCYREEQTLDSGKELSWIHAGLLGAVMRRDGLMKRLEKQSHVLEQARDAAETASLAKSEFIAHMSHELRTPLNGILGFAQILRLDPVLTARHQNSLQAIDDCGRHLLELINNVLDLASIAADKVTLEPAPVDLLSFLNKVTNMLQVKADEKHLRLLCLVSPDLTAAVQVDETRLRQVLLNLLSNAIKFTDSGQVTLNVTRVQDQPSATARTFAVQQVRFEVSDTGIGMTEADSARLFRPFEQVGEISRRHGGTGLGLTISRRLIRLMGGDVHVDSAPGAGSLFWFELMLPLAPPPAVPRLRDEFKRDRNANGDQESNG